jgi:hypothetical protein
MPPSICVRVISFGDVGLLNQPQKKILLVAFYVDLPFDCSLTQTDASSRQRTFLTARARTRALVYQVQSHRGDPSGQIRSSANGLLSV